MINENLIFFHYLVSFISLVILTRSLVKDSRSFFLNYITYLLGFGVLYFSLPSIITLTTMESPVEALPETINFTAYIGLYFNVVFLFAYIYSLKKNQINTKDYKYKNIKLNTLVLMFGLFIFFFVIVLLVLNSPKIISIYGHRRLQADLDQYFNSVFKVYFISIIQIMITGFLFLTSKKKKYLLLYLPFILYGFVLSDRDFIFKGAIFIAASYSLTGLKIKLKYIVAFLTGLVLIGVARSYSLNNPRSLIIASYEFLFTWSTTHLIVESPESSDLLSSIIYSISKASFPGTYQFFFGEYRHYHEVITKNNPLIAGLAGSVVSETLSFKNNFVTFFAPIIISFYGLFLNKFLKYNFLFTKILFIISILFIHSIIRFTFLEYAFYPVFIMIFFGFWIFNIDLKNKKHVL